MDIKKKKARIHFILEKIRKFDIPNIVPELRDDFIPDGKPCPKCNGLGEYPGFSNEWVGCDKCGERGYIDN